MKPLSTSCFRLYTKYEVTYHNINLGFKFCCKNDFLRKSWLKTTVVPPWTLNFMGLLFWLGHKRTRRGWWVVNTNTTEALGNLLHSLHCIYLNVVSLLQSTWDVRTENRLGAWKIGKAAIKPLKGTGTRPVILSTMAAIYSKYVLYMLVFPYYLVPLGNPDLPRFTA